MAAWEYDSSLINSIDPRISGNPYIDEGAGLRIQNEFLDQQRRQQQLMQQGGGREQSGKGSWYSQLPEHGWIDRQDKPGSNALGVPDSQQGIALPSKSTLGQWFDVTAPNGETFRLQQTDIGPSTRTGRGIDISAAAAHQMGYTPKDFPTDGGFSWKPANGPPSGAEAAATGSPAGNPVQADELGSVAAAPYGRPNMNDDNQAQPPGLMQSLFGGLFGGGQQQGAGGVGGLVGAIDPQKMAYLGMIAKGLDPYSSIDPQAMLKNAQQAQQDAMDRQIRQQQLQLNTRAQDRAEMESERPQYITRPDGSIVAVPRQGGSPTIITPGVKDLGETAKQKDYAFAVKNGFKGSFEEFNAQTSMAPEKAYDVKQNTQLAEEQINIQKQGFNAAPQIAMLNQMEKLMDTPGFRSGTGAAFQQTLNKAWTAMGGDPKAPASVEAFNALAQKSVIDDLGSLGTGISNADRDYISGTAASIANTPEGNKQIIAVKRALAQRKQEIAALARDYAKAHGGRLDIGFYDVAEGYAQKNPMFKDVPTPGGDGGGGANAAPASAPPRPPSVPPGSAYSPSRKQWRTPDGQIIDAGQ
jgi:hypothetical protein